MKGIGFAKEQIQWAKAHYPKCEFEYQNFDHLEGEYDRIVCVGMAEHVGRPNLVDFLRSDPKVWQAANQLRARSGQKPLR